MKRSKLKRRLRKKFYVGEFQELGFEVLVKFSTDFNETDFDKFLDEFIDKVEENKLLFGGGGNTGSWEGFVNSSKKYQSPTNAQREQIKCWLEKHHKISECEVGNFKDAWYDID